MSEKKATTAKVDEGRNDGKKGSNGSHPRADSVSQIRDIIFGEQMTDYEGRFRALESKLIAEIEGQRTALDDAISSLQVMVEKRVDDVEDAAVQRVRLASELEKIAHSLREG